MRNVLFCVQAFQKPPIEGEELNVSSLFLKTTEKLKQLIQEDKKKNSARFSKSSVIISYIWCVES